jgi:hypothetical protein
MNDLLGQLSAILQLDTRITLSSDNNPAASVARVIVLDLANCSHQIKLSPYGSNKTYIMISIMEAATPTNALASSYSNITIAQNIAVSVTYLYSEHIISLVTKGQMYLCAFDTGDPLGWHITMPYSDINNHASITYLNYLYVYSPTTDVKQELILASCGYLQGDGKFALLPSSLLGETGTSSSTYQGQKYLIRGGIAKAYLPYGTYASGGKKYLIYPTYIGSALVVCEG